MLALGPEKAAPVAPASTRVEVGVRVFLRQDDGSAVEGRATLADLLEPLGVVLARMFAH